MIGKTISHYNILEKIGEGGMGQVFLAEDTKLKRKVAIKFLPSPLTKDKESRERFEREAQAAAAFNHPNIVTIHEIGEFDDSATADRQTFIAMEYVEGKTLREMINTPLYPPLIGGISDVSTAPNSKFPVPNALNIITQICEGLSKAHQAGIVHRDIKPENILIDSDGRVKILDFGLAKLKGTGNLTKETSTLGTVNYMSPEQAKGNEVDHRTDIWSLGVILYEMLAGQLPFKGEYEQAVIYSILSEEPKALTNISPEINTITNKCLARQTENRYQNIDELMADLQKFINESEAVIVAKEITVNSRYKPFIIPAAITIFFLLIIAGYFIFFKSDIFESKKTGLPEWENSIAILPFEDMSPNKDQEYFCDGIAEEIINKLSSVKTFKVIARTSSFQFKGKLIDISEIGKKLNVNNILEGSVRKSKNMLRITAQLIRTGDGSHIWSQTYDKELNNIFSIQDEIALSVLSNLKLEMSEEEYIIRSGTKNTEAYEAYLQGQFFFDRLTLNDMQKAIEYFRQSIEIDPLFAKAYAGLADVYNNLSMFGESSPRENKLKAKETALKALELDPDLSEAYMVLADIKYGFERDWQEAEELFKKSIKLNPGNAMAHTVYGAFLMAMTRYNETVIEMKKSLKLDPLSIALNMNGYYFSQIANKNDLAEELLQKLLILNLNNSDKKFLEATGYYYKERYDKVITILSGIPDYEADNRVSTLMADTYARLGNTDKVKAILNNLLSRRKNEYIDPFRIAFIYVLLNNKNKAFEWLDKSVSEFSPRIVFIKSFLRLEPIHTDPRYLELLKKIGLEK